MHHCPGLTVVSGPSEVVRNGLAGTRKRGPLATDNSQVWPMAESTHRETVEILGVVDHPYYIECVCIRKYGMEDGGNKISTKGASIIVTHHQLFM